MLSRGFASAGDALFAAFGCALAGALIFIGIEEIKGLRRKDGAFSSLSEWEIKSILEYFGEDGYTHGSYVIPTMVSLCDKGLASKVEVEGVAWVQFKLTERTRKKIKTDPRFKD